MSVKIQSNCKNEKINKLVDFHAANPMIPCVFEYTKRQGVTNKVGVQPQTMQNVPAWMELTVDDGYKKVVYDGAKDLYGPHPHLFDHITGDLRKRVEIKPITFINFRLGIYGDTAERLRLIEYLAHLEAYMPQPNVRHIDLQTQHNGSVNNPLTGYELAKLIDEMLLAKDGQAYLLKRAKDGTLVADVNSVEAMYNLKGIDAVGDILKSAALTDSGKFKKALNKYETEKELYKEAKNIVVGYNPKTKSYQFKEPNGSGEWAKDQILLTTQLPSEHARDLLFFDHIHEGGDVAAKIKILLENAEAVA